MSVNWLFLSQAQTDSSYTLDSDAKGTWNGLAWDAHSAGEAGEPGGGRVLPGVVTTAGACPGSEKWVRSLFPISLSVKWEQYTTSFMEPGED